jgi:hypothetical protein
VDLKFVEDPRVEGELQHDARPVDEHILLAGSVSGLSGRCYNVAHIVHGGPFGHPSGCGVAAEDVAGHAVVVVAAPAGGGLEGPACGDYSASRPDLVHDLAVDVSLPPNRFPRVIPDAVEDPLVQHLPAVAETIVGALVGSRDEPSTDMDLHSPVEDIVHSVCWFEQRSLTLP